MWTSTFTSFDKHVSLVAKVIPSPLILCGHDALSTYMFCLHTTSVWCVQALYVPSLHSGGLFSIGFVFTPLLFLFLYYARIIHLHMQCVVQIFPCPFCGATRLSLSMEDIIVVSKCHGGLHCGIFTLNKPPLNCVIVGHICISLSL